MTSESLTLLGLARAVMRSKAGAVSSVWSRCSALLARQALEKALDNFWSETAPSARRSSRHSQLLCLGTYLGDQHLARRVAQAWSALSYACHHQPYDLPPTAGELEGWMDSVQLFVERTAG